MEKFFVEHHVMRDRDPDELRGHVASDSEASDAEEEITDRVHSVHDATGPWRQTPVDAPWGGPQTKKLGTKNRYFRSEHTGPKGVIKDYKAHKRYQREERERQEKARQDALLHIAKGVTVGSNQHAVCSAADCVCDDEDDMLLNDEFLQKYNAMRMYQMHETAKTSNRFGTLEYISPSEYLKLTDNLPSTVATIVHLYHPESYSCGLMNQHLEEIAKELVHIKFVALIAKEADESITMYDVPVLLVYHGQQHDETIVGLSQKLDGEFTKQRIQQLVLHHTAEKAQYT